MPERWLSPRPAILPSSSSSSSLVGMERAVPSFQSFVSRTPPPPNQSKPLPPVPAMTMQPHDNTVSPRRRSPSVYSCTTSRWLQTPEPFDEWERKNPDAFLQPGVYSSSTPELAQHPPTPPLTQPQVHRPYNDSAVTTPDLTPNPCPSSYSSASHMHQVPGEAIPSKRVATVSLDKAKAVRHSPGNLVLLPEEMRAMAIQQTKARREIRKSRSLETLTSPVLRQAPPALPPLLNVEDYKAPFLRPAALDHQRTKASFYTEGAHEKRYDSQESVVSYEARGRTMEREPARSGTDKGRVLQYGPPKTTVQNETKVKSPTSQSLANDYHALLYDTGKAERRDLTPDSFESTREEMKLVPQPLFFNPRQISEQRTKQYERLKLQQSPARSPQATSSQTRRSSLGLRTQQKPNDALKLELNPSRTNSRRRSTSGSIPISPPVSPEAKESPAPSRDRYDSGFAEQNPYILSTSPQLGENSGYMLDGEQTPYLPSPHYHTSPARVAALAGTPTHQRSQRGRLHWRRPSDSSGGSSLRSPPRQTVVPGSVSRGFGAIKDKLLNDKLGLQTTQKDHAAVTSPRIAGGGRSRMSPIAGPDYVAYAHKLHIGANKLKETSMAGLRKASSVQAHFVHELVEFRKEDKAAKRREELKKSIRHVGDLDSGVKE